MQTKFMDDSQNVTYWIGRKLEGVMVEIPDWCKWQRTMALPETRQLECCDSPPFICTNEVKRGTKMAIRTSEQFGTLCPIHGCRLTEIKINVPRKDKFYCHVCEAENASVRAADVDKPRTPGIYKVVQGECRRDFDAEEWEYKWENKNGILLLILTHTNDPDVKIAFDFVEFSGPELSIEFEYFI